MFEICYHPQIVEKDLPKISSDQKNRIRKSIEGKLAKSPQEFGEPLRRTLKGYWKLRVGDCRIIYKIEDKSIIAFRIGHRREVYER